MTDHDSHSSTSQNDPMHRASYFAKHFLPYILIALIIISLCIIFRHRCCNKITTRENMSGEKSVEGKNSVLLAGGDSLLA